MCLKNTFLSLYTRWESNPYRRNRNPVFYPLNYGCIPYFGCKSTNNLNAFQTNPTNFSPFFICIENSSIRKHFDNIFAVSCSIFANYTYICATFMKA